MPDNPLRSQRRAKRYRRIATRDFGRLCGAYHLWVLRSKAAARGFGPEQLRGKTANELAEILWPSSEE